MSCFALYAWSAAREVMWGDALELVASAITNGVAHPPGYPLWIVLGHLASLAPVGAVAFRVNLTAGLYHAATAGVVYATAYVLTRRIAPSLFAALLLALGSQLFVVWSLQAEVFSLNDLFAAIIVLLCTLWLNDPRRWRLIVPLGALFGLGLSNHQTLILLAPLVIWTAWCGRQTLLRDTRLAATIGISVLVLMIGFWLPYAHTLLASQTLSDTHFGVARTLPQLLDVIERKAYGGFRLEANPEWQGGTFFARLTALIVAGGWPFVFIAAGIGTLALQRRYREFGAATLLVLFSLLAFCAVANSRVDGDYSNGIWTRFGLLPLTALAPFSACAFSALESMLPAGRIRTAGAALVLSALAIIGVRAVLGLSLAHSSDARTYSQDIFNALPRHAILLTGGDAPDLATAYFQTIENWRPDVVVVAYEYLSDPRLARALGDRINIPLNVTRPLPPQTRRDLLMDANRARPFYTTGPSALASSSSEYQPYMLGLVEHMIPRAVRVDVRNHYEAERALMSAPGYGDVTEDRWKSNGWGEMVRAYYADGFLSAGVNAERLGETADARYWYGAAQSYESDPGIQSQWEAQLRAEGLTVFEAKP